ncbi:MAG: LpxI family protein [Elusimicrobia bacterium]|nr:LpxI family protein [Elusimicrobiota bacterium]
MVIGLLAGNGQFPFLFARAARLKGVRVVVAAVRGDTSPLIHFFVDEVRWFSVGELGRFFSFCRERGVTHVLMAGQIAPARLFDKNVSWDGEIRDIFKALSDRRCDTIYGALADRLKREGLELLDSTFLLQDHLAPRGTLTRRAPTLDELADIEFGVGIAKHLGEIDAGQTVVVKGKAVVALEALEGTDACIRRGGRIARTGAVVVKTSKPRQDSRFDVPVIGPRTIETMRSCRAVCLAIEAGKTLIIDRDRTVALADKAGICIVSAGA